MVFAGDDISLENRAQLTFCAHANNPRLAAAAFGKEVIDESGGLIRQPKPTGDKSASRLSFESYMRKEVLHPSAANRSYSAGIYETFGPLSPNCPSEDSPMLLRAMLLGEVWVFPDVVLHYRRHGKNLTNSAMADPSSADELYKQHRLDLERAKKVRLVEGEVAKQYDALLEHYWARRRIVVSGFRDGPFGILSSFMFATDVPAREKIAILRRALGLRRRLRRQGKSRG